MTPGSSRYRGELPPLPAQLSHLPVHRGYPVPWFVAWLADDGQTPTPRGTGTPDFRVLHPGALEQALERSLCWICGDQMPPKVAYAFVVGPMCAVNRVSAEPPSHIICADWAARACPFLVRPKMKRNEASLVEDAVDPAGIALRRNPGVALVWLSKTASARQLPDMSEQGGPRGGILLDIGEPVQTRWYAEGRRATRAEVLESIETGEPILRKLADEQGAGAELDAMLAAALALIPEETEAVGAALPVPPNERS